MTTAPPAGARRDLIDVVDDDAGHGFANPGNRMRLNRAIERHVAERLGGRRAEEDT